jgi:hypothetical protein
MALAQAQDANAPSRILAMNGIAGMIRYCK